MFPSDICSTSQNGMGTTREDCEKKIDKALNRNITVKFMREKLKEAGCEVPRDFFRATRCDQDVSGGFVPGRGVEVCHNFLSRQGDIDRVLVHELVHAFDYCRAKDMDWTICEHHACSEIRAAVLSGDCDYSMEVLRGNFRIKGKFRDCVKRRAALSVALNPNCKEADSTSYVEKMFTKCFEDTAPFDRIP